MGKDSAGDCWSCGERLTSTDYVREGRCPACQKATHVCRNCRFHKPGLNNDCSEPVADYVTDKTRANFCDYFEPVRHNTGDRDAPSIDALRAAAEDLFRS